MALAFIILVALVIAYFSMKSTVLREAADPRFQPLGVPEIEAGLGRLQREARAMVSLAPADGPSGMADSRLGGPIWVPDDTVGWPKDANGDDMLHVAQLDFGAFDPPDSFPRTGLLQVFVRHNGAGLPVLNETEETGDALLIRWYDTAQGGMIVPVPDSLAHLQRGMLASRQARTEGVALQPIRQNLPANPFAWPFSDEVYLNLTRRRPANDSAAQLQNSLRSHFDRILNAYGVHWIGGYPSFSREDIRKRHTALRGLDRVLLHMGFDKHVCIGDAGTLNVLISETDLVNRRFDRAYCASEA